MATVLIELLPLVIGAAVPYVLRGVAPVIGLSTFDEFALQSESPRGRAIADTFARLYDAQTVLASSSRRALAAVEALARTQGATSLGLHVFAFNEGAQALYRRLGYQVASLNLLKPLG